MEKVIHTGYKFYRYPDDSEQAEVVRVYSLPRKNTKSESVICIDSDGNRRRISKSYLLDNYKMLKPDGLMIFSIVNVGESKDVIVALQSINRALDGPYAICRQSIYDCFSNISNTNEDICFVGLSINRDTCPSNVDFNDCMVCSGVEFSKPVGIYIDDTLDNILKLFSNTRFDKALEQCAKHMNTNGDKVYLGLHKTLRDLLNENHFMSDFRKCFNIVELPFTIDEDSESLSNENILFLENEMRQNIMETYVIRYSKEINLRSIKRKYILASSAQDEFKKLFIVGYDTSDNEYIRRI